MILNVNIKSLWVNFQTMNWSGCFFGTASSWDLALCLNKSSNSSYTLTRRTPTARWRENQANINLSWYIKNVGSLIGYINLQYSNRIVIKNAPSTSPNCWELSKVYTKRTIRNFIFCFQFIHYIQKGNFCSHEHLKLCIQRVKRQKNGWKLKTLD